MAPVQKLNVGNKLRSVFCFKLMLFILSFTLTIIYMHFSNSVGIRQIRNASLRSEVK